MHQPSHSLSKVRKHMARLEKSFPAVLVRRFIDADVMTQAAALADRKSVV